MKRTIIALTIFSLVIFSCTTVKIKQTLTFQDLKTPPGTIMLAENVFIDKNEIRNIDYLEFLQWTKTIYGIDSDEYKQIQPVTTFWHSIDPDIVSIESLLSINIEYRNLPVLGVNLEQAKKFSKWRSDRVMEFMLISYKIIDYEPKPNKDSFFSIEKYFTGTYKNLQPNPSLIYYPVYSLFDSTDCTLNGFKNSCAYKKWGN